MYCLGCCNKNDPEKYGRYQYPFPILFLWELALTGLYYRVDVININDSKMWAMLKG